MQQRPAATQRLLEQKRGEKGRCCKQWLLPNHLNNIHAYIIKSQQETITDLFATQHQHITFAKQATVQTCKHQTTTYHNNNIWTLMHTSTTAWTNPIDNWSLIVVISSKRNDSVYPSKPNSEPTPQVHESEASCPCTSPLLKTSCPCPRIPGIKSVYNTCKESEYTIARTWTQTQLAVNTDNWQSHTTSNWQKLISSGKATGNFIPTVASQTGRMTNTFLD